MVPQEGTNGRHKAKISSVGRFLYFKYFENWKLLLVNALLSIYILPFQSLPKFNYTSLVGVGTSFSKILINAMSCTQPFDYFGTHF